MKTDRHTRVHWRKQADCITLNKECLLSRVLLPNLLLLGLTPSHAKTSSSYSYSRLSLFIRLNPHGGIFIHFLWYLKNRWDIPKSPLLFVNLLSCVSKELQGDCLAVTGGGNCAQVNFGELWWGFKDAIWISELLFMHSEHSLWLFKRIYRKKCLGKLFHKL